MWQFLFLVGCLVVTATVDDCEENKSDNLGVLVFASVLTRHGDRTPVRVFPATVSQWPEVGLIICS
jgi:hypothetical protein